MGDPGDDWPGWFDWLTVTAIGVLILTATTLVAIAALR